MQKTILQIPIDRELKNNAERIATSQGFSSLQEIIRVFLSKLAANDVRVTFQESVNLSSKNEKRYMKMTRDFKSGKNISTATDVDDLISKLNTS